MLFVVNNNTSANIICSIIIFYLIFLRKISATLSRSLRRAMYYLESIDSMYVQAEKSDPLSQLITTLSLPCRRYYGTVVPGTYRRIGETSCRPPRENTLVVRRQSSM